MVIPEFCRTLHSDPHRRLTPRNVVTVTRLMTGDDRHHGHPVTLEQLELLADRFRLSAHERKTGRLTGPSTRFMNAVCTGAWSANRIERIWAGNPGIVARGALLRWATTHSLPWTDTLLIDVAEWARLAPDAWIRQTFTALHHAALSRQPSHMPPAVRPAFWRLLCLAILEPTATSAFARDSLVLTLLPDFVPDTVSPAILGVFLRSKDQAVRQWAVECLAPVTSGPVGPVTGVPVRGKSMTGRSPRSPSRRARGR